MRYLAPLLLALSTSSVAAQEGALDVLDGETLYEDGWLFTLGYEFEHQQGLREGRRRVNDPLDRKQMEHITTVSAHYGLLHTLQLTAIVPYVRRELRLHDPAGPDRLSADGLGDSTLLAKWRFYRWDTKGQTLNIAALSGLDLPTGSDHERDHGVRLPRSLQPGSGSCDPFVGAAATYEPYRWRFNAFALYKRHGEGGQDLKEGDQLFAELAAGNRFWLEPYPGPFMRFDVMLRHRHDWRGRQDGDIVHNSGGDLITVGANLAFRPRPVLDFQVAVEFAVWQRVEGVQLEEDFSVFFVFGYRI
jgi:hypothetical protein